MHSPLMHNPIYRTYAVHLCCPYSNLKRQKTIFFSFFNVQPNPNTQRHLHPMLIVTNLQAFESGSSSQAGLLRVPPRLLLLQTPLSCSLPSASAPLSSLLHGHHHRHHHRQGYEYSSL